MNPNSSLPIFFDAASSTAAKRLEKKESIRGGTHQTNVPNTTDYLSTPALPSATSTGSGGASRRWKLL